MLAVPLAQPRGEGLGIVLVFFSGEELFDDDQLELAGHVAGAARGALERSELYERERRSRSLAQQLASAGRELAGELDPDTVLDQCARLAAALVEADGASVRVLEDDEVVVRAAAGAGEADALGARTPSTAWLVGDIVQTRSTRSIADVRADPRIGEVDSMLAAGYAAYLGVPIVGPDGSAQGILAVYAEQPARLARGGGGGAADAGGDGGSGARERRPLPGGQQRAAAQRGDPRQRRRRDRRRRPRGQGRSLEPRRGARHRRARRPRRSAGRRRRRSVARSTPRTCSAAAGSCRSGAAARRSGCRSARR